jgi:hypothetical protein
MRTKIFMSCRSRSYEVAMNRFQKDLDLILTVMSEAADPPEAGLAGPEALIAAAAKRPLADRLDPDDPKALKKTVETFNYPDWVDFKKPDMPKAWRARPGFMRGIEVSREKAKEYKDESVREMGGVSSTEKVITLKNGKQIFGKVTAEGDNYIVETNKGDIKIPKSKVFSVEGKKALDHLTGKYRETLSKITLPLEHGWTEKEILYAMWNSILNKAAWFTKYKGKWDKGLTFDDAVQVAGLALLDAIRTDVGGAPFSVHAATHMNKYLTKRAKKEREIQKKEGISYDQPVQGAAGEEKNPLLDLLAGTGVDEIIKQGLWDQVWAVFEKSKLSNLERDIAVRLLGIGMDSGERWTPLDKVILKAKSANVEGETLEGRHIRTGGTATRPTVTLRMADGKEKTISKSDIDKINPDLPSGTAPQVLVTLQDGEKGIFIRNSGHKVVLSMVDDSERTVAKSDIKEINKLPVSGGAPSLLRVILQDGRVILGRKAGVETKGNTQILIMRTMGGEEVRIPKDDIAKLPDGALMSWQVPGETSGMWHNPDVHRRAVGRPSEPKPMREVEIAKELGVDESTIKSAKKGIKTKFAEALKAIGYKPGEGIVGKVKASPGWSPTESVEPKVSLNEWKRQMGLRIL